MKQCLKRKEPTSAAALTGYAHVAHCACMDTIHNSSLQMIRMKNCTALNILHFNLHMYILQYLHETLYLSESKMFCRERVNIFSYRSLSYSLFSLIRACTYCHDSISNDFILHAKVDGYPLALLVLFSGNELHQNAIVRRS